MCNAPPNIILFCDCEFAMCRDLLRSFLWCLPAVVSWFTVQEQSSLSSNCVRETCGVCTPKNDTDTKVSRFKRKLVLQIKRPCQISTSKFLRHVRCLVAKQTMEAAKDMRFLCERQQALVRTLLKDTTYFLLRSPESEPVWYTIQNTFFPFAFFCLSLAFLTVRAERSECRDDLLR